MYTHSVHLNYIQKHPYSGIYARLDLLQMLLIKSVILVFANFSWLCFSVSLFFPPFVKLTLQIFYIANIMPSKFKQDLTLLVLIK